MVIKRTFIAFMVCLWSSPTVGADIENLAVDELFNYSLEDLMNIRIVSASLTEAPVKDLPLTSFVITREEILDNAYTSLTDALKDLPGIKVSQLIGNLISIIEM